MWEAGSSTEPLQFSKGAQLWAPTAALLKASFQCSARQVEMELSASCRVPLGSPGSSSGGGVSFQPEDRGGICQQATHWAEAGEKAETSSFSRPSEINDFMYFFQASTLRFLKGKWLARKHTVAGGDQAQGHELGLQPQGSL